jgi:hypothetical protein
VYIGVHNKNEGKAYFSTPSERYSISFEELEARYTNQVVRHITGQILSYGKEMEYLQVDTPYQNRFTFLSLHFCTRLNIFFGGGLLENESLQ